MCLNSLYWSFLITSTSLNCIESSWLDTLYFTVLKLFEDMYITSMYWSFLSTQTLLVCIEDSWVHLLHFIVLKLLEHTYLTWMYWKFLSKLSKLLLEAKYTYTNIFSTFTFANFLWTPSQGKMNLSGRLYFANKNKTLYNYIYIYIWPNFWKPAL